MEHRLVGAGRSGWMVSTSRTHACGWGTRSLGWVALGTLLGPEGSGDRVRTVSGSGPVFGCSGWLGPCRVVGVTCGGWGCRLYVENFTVDASIFVAQVFKGARWMPWYQEPKKDVGICDKPRVVDNQTVIRGFPNGETRLEASPVTRT